MRSNRPFRVAALLGLLLAGLLWGLGPLGEAPSSPTERPAPAASTSAAPSPALAPPEAPARTPSAPDRTVLCPIPATAEGQEVRVKATDLPPQTVRAEGGAVTLSLPQAPTASLTMDTPGYRTIFAEVQADGRCAWSAPPLREIPLTARILGEDGGPPTRPVSLHGCELSGAQNPDPTRHTATVALPEGGSCVLSAHTLVEHAGWRYPFMTATLQESGRERFDVEVRVPREDPAGIGAFAGHTGEEGGPMVWVHIIPNSPAHLLGLWEGQRVFEVDGLSTEALSPAEINVALLGEDGTQVSLVVDDYRGPHLGGYPRRPWAHLLPPAD